jgi:hypothetical protein
MFADYPPRVLVDGPKKEDWETVDAFRDKYEYPLWKTTGELARKMGGHEGMDYIMNYRLMDCPKRGLVPDINVYDAAAWSAPTPLSETSVSHNGAPPRNSPISPAVSGTAVRTLLALQFRLECSHQSSVGHRSPL